MRNPSSPESTSSLPAASGAPATGPSGSAPALRPTPVALPLAELIKGLDVELLVDPQIQLSGTQVSGISMDSRTVQPGDLYAALPGSRAHGAAFWDAARQAGAAAVLTDAEGRRLLEQAAEPGELVPVLIAEQPRRLAGELASRIYGHPGDRLLCFAVTGTNGKTTTSFLLEAGLLAAGRHVGTVGTMGFRLDAQELPSGRSTITTPEATDLQGLFALFAQQGADAVAMEVSSIALDQWRVAGCHFAVSAFTNLGRDHLDYHHTMEAYFEAKARLFTPELTDIAVIAVDDPAGRTLAERCRELGMPVIGTGFSPEADWQILGWQPSPRGGSRLQVQPPSVTPGDPAPILDVEINLPGEYNVRNAVTAAAMIQAAGLDLAAALPGISRASVPGRMQLVPLGSDAPRVYVDFAHTPQAISSALAAVPRSAAEGAGGRVICVLGAGGDRDASKRGPMGAAAVQGSDVVIVTDDNPRSEDPAAIRQAVLDGARAEQASAAPSSRAAGVQILDGGLRSAAIGQALALAGPDDAVLILGKGHEKTQQIGQVAHRFDDVQQAQQAWQTRHVGQGQTGQAGEQA